MELSIIKIKLNNHNCLQRTIESVATQTFKDFEWLVIDGGSTNGSKEAYSFRESFHQTPEQDRKDLIARGRERAKLFSWEESARKLKQVYVNLL